MNNPVELTFRDYLAAHASEKDIVSVKYIIPEGHKIRDLSPTWREPYYGLPDNWRQVARYIHADRMLEARRIK